MNGHPNKSSATSAVAATMFEVNLYKRRRHLLGTVGVLACVVLLVLVTNFRWSRMHHPARATHGITGGSSFGIRGGGDGGAAAGSKLVHHEVTKYFFPLRVKYEWLERPPQGLVPYGYIRTLLPPEAHLSSWFPIKRQVIECPYKMHFDANFLPDAIHDHRLSGPVSAPLCPGFIYIPATVIRHFSCCK